MLGRREGPLASVLGEYGSVSGHHAEVRYTQETGWTITDTGSTNGTQYNGHPLTPHQPVPLQDGGSLILAQAVEFYIRIEMPTSEGSSTLQEQVPQPRAGTIRV